MAKKPVKVAKKVLRQLERVTTPTLTTQLMKNHGLHNTSLAGVLAIDPELKRFAGPAYTLRYAPLREDLLDQQWLDHPQNMMTPAVEDIPEGAVMVLDAGGRTDVGMLGGNILMRLKVRGVAGAVTDGGMRDIPEIEELGFPVAAAAAAPPPSFARLMLVDVQCPVVCGGVTVFPGDIIVGDGEGTVAIPAALAKSVAEGGLAQDHLEAWVQRRLAEGEPLPGLYPPDEKRLVEYRAWVAAGEPGD